MTGNFPSHVGDALPASLPDTLGMAGTLGNELVRLAESLLDRKPRYRLIFSSGLYAWYRLPACEVPLRLPLWPGKVEHYDQERRIVLLRPAIAGYEHETEEVHLTQVVAWFQVNLDRGTVKEVLLHAPRIERADQADRRSNAQAVKESSQ
ncbi:MAG: hypothetical protein IMW89_01470 [Ktedonobacteraceae bacterium]|nr:hypothetical protein [Ktedonobacteraceae bacterium]